MKFDDIKKIVIYIYTVVIYQNQYKLYKIPSVGLSSFDQIIIT